ncbi:hypothetical protein C6499_18350 [Candidatus Poribacteria bacterium]|nr:MAG: hypothetical protein C6499_18350 [Candidatus Poribacteria bacterium]
MENQQLEFDLSNTSTLVLELTGNPWTDFGIVSFCAELRYTPFHCELELTPHEATITMDVANLEEFEEWLNQRFLYRWNQLYWLSRGAKILGRGRDSLIYDDGFVDRDKSQMQTTEEDRGEIKEKWKNSTVGDVMPLTQLRSNFIGINGNADKFRTEQQANIREFIENWQNPIGKKVCEMSGRTTAKPKKLLQVVNPFATKHHNTRVRGAHSSSTNPTIGQLYYLISLCATLDKDIPFTVNTAKRTTRLILPDIQDLELLTKVYTRLKDNLKDLDQPNELWTFTNLRTMFGSTNRYSLTISLFHNIFYQFTPSDDAENEGEWDFSSLVEQTTEAVRRLTRWVIIPFTKGQNVIFQNFHTVEVDTRLYDFIKPIDFVPREIQLVPDILIRMLSRTPDGENAIGQLSQAIATSAPSLMKVALFNIWKHQDAVLISPQRGAPHPVRLLSTFINHFLEVNQVLDEKLREDLRVIGTTIGTIFYKDVTLISKLFNISSVNAFRDTLNVVMFRLYKFSTSEDAKKAVPVKQERIDHILNELTDRNYKEIAETLSTYVCLNAYNAKVFESKSDNGGSQNG